MLNGTQYCYDGRGNRVRSIASNGTVQQIVSYTAYGQAREVKSTVAGTQGHVTRYYYGPERQRIRRMDFYNSSATGSADIADEVSNAEIITRLGSTTRELRRSLGPVILSRMINSGGVVIGSNARFLFTDAQGSPHRITAADGTLVGNEGSRWFTAFGARADTGDGDELTLIQVLNTATDQITRMSYTGHEAADAVGLIHMNGRMYDPIAGRFLQADPIVQDPSNPQNFNRYTYVFNNPLAWTDPTGHWGAREQGTLRTVAAIVIAIYTGVYINPGTAALTSGQVALVVASGAAVGALQTGTLRGALVGAFTAGVGIGIGQAFAQGTMGYVAAHAVLGGVTSILNGGKFGHGFIAAGFSTALSPAINTGNAFGDGFLHALVGGTASRLSGGKFANGAVTAAFSFAVGRVASRSASGSEEGDSICVTGCTKNEGSLPPASSGGLADYFWNSDPNAGLGNPMMDRAAYAALDGLRHSSVGEWTGYLQWRGPGYVASQPVLISAQPIGRCYQVTFSVPQDAVAIYHSHMRFDRDVRGYQAMNRALDNPGPKDHWTLYGRTSRPNYFRGASGGISVIERSPYIPALYSQRRL